MYIKKNIKQYIVVFILTTIGILLDQISKLYVMNVLKVESLSKGNEIIKNFLYITKVHNTGGAWGIFSNNTIILAIISLLVLIMIYIFMLKEEKLNIFKIIYYSMIFSGITGNMLDRVVNNYVFDFINVYLFGYDYPVFNVADIFIVLGIIFMLIDIIRGDINDRNSRKGKC